MAKQKRKAADAIAREKLTDSQAKLAAAQERRRRIIEEGDAEMERARQRAANRLDKATKEVERRAGKVARAEGKLLSLLAKERPPATESVPAIEVTESATSSPGAAADHLEALAAEAPSATTPEDDNGSAPGNGIGRNEIRLLLALRDNFDAGGATFSQWLGASALSKRTFLRARRILVDGGMVEHHGSGVGTRYVITDSGLSKADSAG